MPEDPRILTRKRFLFLSGCLPCGEISLHDLAQRERIATLEADNRRLREALEESWKWLEVAKKGLCLPIAHLSVSKGYAAPEVLRQLSEVIGEIPTIPELRTALQPSPVQSGATERAAIMEISRTCGDRSLSEIDLRVKIIGICHGVLVPQLSGNSGEMETAIRRIHDRERGNGSAA